MPDLMIRIRPLLFAGCKTFRVFDYVRFPIHVKKKAFRHSSWMFLMEKLGGRKLDRQIDLGFELLLEYVGSKKAE